MLTIPPSHGRREGLHGEYSEYTGNLPVLAVLGQTFRSARAAAPDSGCLIRRGAARHVKDSVSLPLWNDEPCERR